MKRIVLLAAGLSATLSPKPARAESRPVVAVFDINDSRKKGKLPQDALEQMTSYLLAKIAESQTYKVVPRDQVIAAIAAQKKDTFKACYDEKCQIELGKELAAEKSLGTVILEIGGRCVLTSTLYDLRTAVSERAATKKTTCDQGAIADAIDAVVEQIAKGAGPAAVPVAEPVVAKREEPPKQPAVVPDVRVPDKIAGVAFPNSADGQACAAGKGASCRQAAADAFNAGQNLVALKVADRGCSLGNGNSCSWAAKISYNDRELARCGEYARTGCTLDDGESCSWIIKLDYEAGKRPQAATAAAASCDRLKHSGSCSWAATVYYELGDRAKALDYSTRGCDLGEAEACGWNTKISYEVGNKQRALDVGTRACNEMRHAAACSWAASIEYERGDVDRAYAFARRGCDLNGPDACSWKRKIENERGAR